VGQFVTATATDRSTTDFSACVLVQDSSRVGVVNSLVMLRSVTAETIQGTPPPGVVGTMRIRATFKNTSSTPIGAPFFVITELTGGNLLLNADGGPAATGGRLTPNVGSDGIFAPGETFTAEFDIGLWSGSPFTFFVDLWGEPNP